MKGLESVPEVKEKEEFNPALIWGPLISLAVIAFVVFVVYIYKRVFS
jgi:hypothetical protein